MHLASVSPITNVGTQATSPGSNRQAVIQRDEGLAHTRWADQRCEPTGRYPTVNQSFSVLAPQECGVIDQWLTGITRRHDFATDLVERLSQSSSSPIQRY